MLFSSGDRAGEKAGEDLLTITSPMSFYLVPDSLSIVAPNRENHSGLVLPESVSERMCGGQWPELIDLGRSLTGKIQMGGVRA